MLAAKPGPSDGKTAPADGKDNEKSGKAVEFMDNKKKLPNTDAYKGLFLKHDSSKITMGKSNDIQLLRLPGGGLTVVAPNINFISQSISASASNILFRFAILVFTRTCIPPLRSRLMGSRILLMLTRTHAHSHSRVYISLTRIHFTHSHAFHSHSAVQWSVNGEIGSAKACQARSIRLAALQRNHGRSLVPFER